MKKKKRISTLEVVAISLFIFVVMIFLIPSLRRSVEPSSTRAQTNSVESRRTLEEMQAFLNTHLQTLVTETLPRRQFRFPEIQQRYDTLVQMIRKRYGKEHVFQAVGTYAAPSKLTTMGAGIPNGVPTVAISMPALMDVYETRQKLGANEEEFELSCVVDLLHELDHLAHGYLREEGAKAYPFEKWIENEKRAWAETCEYAIRPLIETHQLHLSPNERAYYRGWVQSGRDVHSVAWGNFIRRHYEKVRQ